ncbi:MAG: mechanosensitive ion channel family protein [Tepidisphaeraceae bacterium]
MPHLADKAKVMIRRVFRFVLPLALLAAVCVQIAVAQDVSQPAVAAATQAATQMAAAVSSSTTAPVIVLNVPASQPSVSLEDVVLRGKQIDPWELAKISFWQKAVYDVIGWVLQKVPQVIVAFLLFTVSYIVFRVIRRIIKSSSKAAGIDDSIRDMTIRMVKIIVLGFGLVIAGNQIGIEITALLTGVSIIGLAVGFAAQESISNFIAGVMIFVDKPFRPGDWINVDGHTAQVKRVTFRSTRLVDIEGDTVIFPNTAMLNRKLVNKSTNPITRIAVTIPVTPDVSIDAARETLLQVLNADPRVEKAPGPEVVIKGVGLNEMFLLIHFWIKEERYEDAMTFDYLERAKKALDAAGITRKKAG